ncbi:hypothetical protein DFR41_1095 [Pseudacidovorax intermedius]|uniref:Uncharacterized protein n=1 Tax=Pseudacidovorax intermedius TaxID=433924 RepID=A0A370F8T9_9BURK|nr:hypothetical protein DFR41_1095 [Pseudacidovorax intermedius]
MQVCHPLHGHAIAFEYVRAAGQCLTSNGINQNESLVCIHSYDCRIMPFANKP